MEENDQDNENSNSTIVNKLLLSSIDENND